MRLTIIQDGQELDCPVGQVRTYAELIPNLRDLGHDIAVITPEDFKYHRPFPGYREIQLTIPKGLAGKIRKSRPDVVHSATEGPLGLASLYICQQEGIPVTTASCTNVHKFGQQRMPAFLRTHFESFAGQLVALYHNLGELVIVPLSERGEELKKHGLKKPFHAIGRPVDTNLFHLGSSDLFSRRERPVSLCVSRLEPEKGVEQFLEMDIPGTRVVVGAGSLLQEFKKKYSNHKSIVFYGEKRGKELVACYRAADFLVFPSTKDTYGRVIPEALACGLPFLAFNLAAAGEFAKTNPRFGVCVEPGEKLDKGFDQLQDLIPQNGQRAALATARFNYIRDNHSPMKIAARFMQGHLPERQEEPDIARAMA